MIGIEHVYTNCHHKLKALHELRDIWSMEPDEIMYMGDDVPDLEPMTHVGMPVCPADAAVEVIEHRATSPNSTAEAGRARHRRAGAPRPRRLGQKLRRRDSLVAGRLAVSLLPGTDGTDNQDKRDKTRKRQAARLQTKKQPPHDRLFPYPQEPHPQKTLYCIHSTFAASRNSRLSGRTRLSASGAKMNRTLSTGTVRKTVEG